MIVYFIIALEQAVDDREVNFWMVNMGWTGFTESSLTPPFLLTGLA